MLQAFSHWLGYGLCHQLPERSFFGGGVQLPVCARDTGIYLGFCVGLILIAWLHRPQRPREFPTVWGWTAFTLLLGSMAVDGGTEYAGLRTTTNDLRLITGLAAGFAIAMLLTPMLNDSVWRRSDAVRVFGQPHKLLVWLAAIPAMWVLLWFGAPLLCVGYVVIVVIAVLATLTCVNLVMVCLTPWFDRKAVRLLDVWPSALVALGFALTEIWLAGLLRAWLVALAARVS